MIEMIAGFWPGLLWIAIGGFSLSVSRILRRRFAWPRWIAAIAAAGALPAMLGIALALMIAPGSGAADDISDSIIGLVVTIVLAIGFVIGLIAATIGFVMRRG